MYNQYVTMQKLKVITLLKSRMAKKYLGVALGVFAILFIALFSIINLSLQSLNDDINEEVKKDLLEQHKELIHRITYSQSLLVNSHFENIESLTGVYQLEIQRKLAKVMASSHVNKVVAKYNSSTFRYSRRDDYVSMVYPLRLNNSEFLSKQELSRIRRGVDLSHEISILLNELPKRFEFIKAAWISTEDYVLYSPAIDLDKQIPPGDKYTILNGVFWQAVIPKNNPQMIGKWTPAYEDPAGQGLMISYVIPLIVDNKFYGSFGMDLTLDEIALNILTKNSTTQSSFSFLMNSKGELVVFPKEHEDWLGLRVPEHFHLNQDFTVDLKKSQKNEIRSLEKKIIESTSNNFFHTVSNQEYIISSQRLKKLNYTYVKVIPLSEAFKFLQRNKEKLLKTTTRINEYLVVMLILSCGLSSIILFSFLGRNLFRRINLINDGFKKLANDDYPQLEIDRDDDEITDLIKSFNDTVHILKKSKNELIEHKENLEFLVEKRTAELKSLQNELLIAAHDAGKAEMAIGVLHNIGNTMTAVNILCETLMEVVQKDKARNRTSQLLAMLSAHKNELQSFISSDEKGQLIPEFLLELFPEIEISYQNVVSSLKTITESIDYVRDAVRSQQEISSFDNFKIETNIDELIGLVVDTYDALAKSHDIRVIMVCDLQSVIKTNPSKLSMVLGNLVKNAIESFGQLDQKSRLIRISAKENNSQIQIHVCDNGVGIPDELRSRLFTFRFTTKENGSGYGLHSSFYLIKDLGGNLVYNSDNEDETEFIIYLPLED